MAVLIQGCNVIARSATIEAKYPGGINAYWRESPNRTFCADEHLCRIGFMVQEDAERFVAELAGRGLSPTRSGVADDVVIVMPESGPLVACDWLALGVWGKTPIAWLSGVERGDFHAPPGWNANHVIISGADPKMRERIEYLRTEGNLDVYRDRETGQLLYSGRTGQISPQDVKRHDQLFEQAKKLVEDSIVFSDHTPAALGWFARRRLKKAIPLLTEVVQINPGSAAAMFYLGKIYQRFEEFEKGLEWFARAHRVHPELPDLAREASIAAMDLDRPGEAVSFCLRALEVRPDDAGLRSNLALALLFSGRVNEAHAAAEDSQKRDPRDQITANIVRLIEEVLDGKRPCPRHVRDIR